ncbi:MAG: bifunctional tRNA (5-methylaminomethyl-2-thiouridine)(34)-methyltransferase MnmD/FAD-dependent 5-carboxymethylaminomethyl-2-thiouridine(34) oxidoreductase MnmC, partial [Zoogloeaceae bacterium]|nr:bifunctional tRNA (5-methylaminomethyl-2-thiouridine)(34)-methyltransferase MnmD/FAD-dependent 5-carboxymethylaminomethyl-2-thiouridine(34) oxidoreductase MnmC [Zoogloeaceae bacterium]
MPELSFTPDGTPYSSRYDDVYHTCHGGLGQARHVFLGGNGLPERWRGRERFVILETGFGLGLNFLATWAAWREDAQAAERLHFVSVEKHPLARSELEKAHAALRTDAPELAPLAAGLREHWPLATPGIHRLFFARGRLVLTLVFGDAATTLKKLVLAADALYLDGFSPAKNPDLWTPEICWALARLAAPGATLATWSVSGTLRAALAANAFDVEKRPGFSGKRQMLVGRYRSRKPDRFPLPPREERRALVLGAGVAGTSAAAALAARGWQVEVLERMAEAGQGASGNLAGVLRPLPSADDNFLSRLTRAGFGATVRHLRTLEAADLPVRWGATGALHLARDAAQEALQRRAVERLAAPAGYVTFLDAAAASRLLGRNVPRGGWWFPQGGWAQPFALCRANLLCDPERIRFRPGLTVARVERVGGLWRALDAAGVELSSAPHLVMAAGVAAPGFAPFAWLPQKSARGQVTWLARGQGMVPMPFLVCGKGYVTPAVDGVMVAGASFHLEDASPGLRAADHAENLAKLAQLLPGFVPPLAEESIAALPGRVGFRPMSPDRLPIVGAVPVPDRPFRRHMPTQPGLWCVQGFGSRGIVWAALMADLLASRMNGDPLPLETDLA